MNKKRTGNVFAIIIILIILLVVTIGVVVTATIHQAEVAHANMVALAKSARQEAKKESQADSESAAKESASLKSESIASSQSISADQASRSSSFAAMLATYSDSNDNDTDTSASSSSLTDAQVDQAIMQLSVSQRAALVVEGAGKASLVESAPVTLSLNQGIQTITSQAGGNVMSFRASGDTRSVQSGSGWNDLSIRNLYRQYWLNDAAEVEQIADNIQH